MTLIMCDCTVNIKHVGLIYNACGNTYFFLLQPTVSAKSQSILITPGNVRYLADFIASSATIDSRVDPFASVGEQPMRSYSKFPLLLQESWMHMPPSESQLDSHLSLVTVILVLALVMELM